MQKETKEHHPDWWRVEKFQSLLGTKAENTDEPEGKALFTEASSRFNALVELTLTGSFGRVSGKPATLEQAVDYAVTPVNKVRVLAEGGKRELFEPWEDVLKSFQYFGGDMMKVLQEARDARIPSASLKNDVVAPVAASFKAKPKA